MAYSVQVGAGETYFSAFALFLNATAQQIALVSTLPQLLGSSAQIFSAWLGGYAGRRRVVLLGCALQALLWLPILLVPLLFRQYAVTGLLALLALYFSANNLAAPQWTSIMRDLVSEGDRAALLRLLERARSARVNLPTPAARPEDLAEIRLPVPDRPGVLAEVTTLASELGVDIEDLEIAHSAEGPGGVLVLVVEASSTERVRGALAARGYRPSVRALA